MGGTFKYIDEGALSPCGGEQCHLCECTDALIFPYNGSIIDPALAKNPELAREEPDVSELCAACILGGNVRKSNVAMKEIMPTIQKFSSDIQRAIEEYNRTPDLSFIQGENWPMCCGEFAEYTGEHPTPGTSFADYEVWQPQDSRMAQFKLEDFYPLEKIPVMKTMALFRCLHCARRYWVFQYSGLFWPGPVATKPGR